MPARSLRLYVWEGEGILQDYDSGMIVALAHDAEEARALVRATDYGYLPSVLEALGREPAVYDEPTAHLVFGGG